jgi:hypothetical protein
MSVGIYIAATSTQLFSWGVSSFKKCLSRQHRNEQIEDDLAVNNEESTHPYQPLVANDTNRQTRHASYRGNIFTRSLSDEIKRSESTSASHFRHTF